MIGVAVTSADIKELKVFEGQAGHKSAIKLCQNTEKISSFCGDVVGDICSILSGAGGVSLVLNMHIHNANVYFIITCLVSSLIAGLTIFGKAVMKGYAVDNCQKVVIKTGKILETSPLTYLKSLFKRKKDKNKKVTSKSKLKK